MKNRYSIRLLVIVFLSAFAMGICYSCSDDDGEGVKVYEYREQIGKKTSNPQLSSSASFLRLNVLSSLN